MSIKGLKRFGASGLFVRAAVVYAVAGTLSAVSAFGQQDEAMPELTPEMRAKLEELMKQAGAEEVQESAREVGQEGVQKPGQPGAKVAPPTEKSKELSGEESIARFQQLLARRPFHGPAFSGLVEDYAKRGKLAELVAEYVSKSAALPDDVALKIVLARLQLRVGDAKAAAAVLEKVSALPAELARQNSEFLVLKAEVYQKTGDNEGAERTLKEAQAAAGSVSESLKLGEALADLYLRDGKQEKAVAALEELAGRFPENYLHQKHVAAALSQRGLHEAAAKRYGEMLKLVGAEVDRRCEVLRELGMAQEKLGTRDEAIASYVEAIGLLSSDHWLQKELHERVVTLYRAANRLEDLATYCTAQIKRAPEQTAMRVLLADVQGAMGKVEEGKATLATAVELFPKDLALSQKRVDFLERVGDAAGVAAEYQRIIGQYPADTELMIGYGQFLANNHQVEGARGQWRHVLGTKVDDPTLALRLGALFEAYELYDDAGDAYERAIAVQPKMADAYVALSRMWLLRGEAEKAAGVLDRMGAANANDSAVQAALAQALRNIGKVDAALAAIGKACEIAPDQVKYQQMKAELLVQGGQLEQALEVRRAVIDRVTNSVQQAEAIGTLVSMYESAGKLAGLVESEKKRVAEKPGDVVGLLILAKAADNQRDFPGMRKALEALLEVDAGNETALVQLAKLQDATGDIDAAGETYTKLIQLHPARSRQFYEAMVDLKMRYQDRAGAVTTLEGMAAADPTNVATLSAVAEQMVRMEEAERALPYFEKALRAQPDRHESRLEYGKALVQAGRLEDALAAFKVVALQRTDTDRAGEALAKLHDTATQLGSLEELVDELHQQVEIDPQNTTVARVLAQLLVHELEYGRAMELLDLVMRHNPRDVDLALARAELLRRLAKFDDAVEGYQRVLRFPQIDRDYVLGELGKTHFESGQVDQARRLWKQVQHKMYAGSLLKNNGLVEDAIAVLEEGIRLKPDDYALHRNLVAALEAAGRTPEALAAARRLLDLEPANVWNIEKLAAAHLRSGDRAGAAAVAARLFSAGVAEDKTQQKGGGGYGSFAGAMQQAAYSSYYSSYYGYGYGQAAKTNLDRGIAFFIENGLVAELEDVLKKQIAEQPENAVLKKAAANLYGSQLNKPELALTLLRELETAKFPVEHQEWLGKSSQRDHLRVEQYNLIAGKPTLRDAELARLEGKKAEELARDELVELAVIKLSQGNTDNAAELMVRALKADADDTLALGVLTGIYVGAEKFKEAEPHARKLVELLGAQREQMRAGTIERVRREFVRTLPLEHQLRVTEDLLADIAEKWTMGAGWGWYEDGVEIPGYLKAKLTLGTILAETERMEEARGIWKDLAPKSGPDVDRWTMLGDTAQLHKQEDLSFEFYQSGLKAAQKVTGDPLLQQIYMSSVAQQSWYGDDGEIDEAFSSIVEAFNKREALVQLYDFLRDTNQEGKARRLAEQYKLGEQLKPLYLKRFEDARKAFKASSEPMKASVPYFAAACKLAELYDREANWDEAQKVYERYVTDFPDELGLLQTLGEVAQARQKMDEAIKWEKQVLECKTRLAKKAREWSMRDLALTPSRPQALAGRADSWTWMGRWGGSSRGSYYGYGGQQNQLERWPSWMRLAQLYLAENNPIAAGDAMQRGVGEATAGRDQVVRQAAELIQQRQLTAKMLPVLRTLAVYAPANERVQLAFADSLEAAGKKELAAEVCNRLLRRGVTDLGVLAEVKRRVNALNPEAAPEEVTVASLEAEVANSPENLKSRLRLAKAYYYSLEVSKAAGILEGLAKEAPHLEGIHELLVEVCTLRGDSEKLVEALKAQIERTTDDSKRRQLRWRVVDELLAAGRNDEALTTVKELGDPKDPNSYVRIGALLQYFGRYEEAIACIEKAKASTKRNPYGGSDGSDFGVAQAMAVRGDFAGAAAKIMEGVSEQSKQQRSSGGGSVYGMYDNAGSPFQQLEHVFVLYPQLADEVRRLVEAKLEAGPTDQQAVKLMMGLHKSLGRPDRAQAMMDKMVQEGASDQQMVVAQIDKALERKDYPKAIELAEKFITQQPKPKAPPGMPAMYAAYAVMQSPRTFMTCKLGDVYWEMGQKDKAFETYKQIVDEKIDMTRMAYGAICLVRGRTEEAAALVDEQLKNQKVRPPLLLQFKAALAVLDGKPDVAFDALAEAAKHDTGESNPYSYRGGGSPVGLLNTIAERANLTEKFAELVRERIKKNPHDWDNYSMLATMYWDAGHTDEALKVVAEAEKEPSLTAQALQTRLGWTQTTATADELIAMYEKLIELSEKQVETDTSRRYGYEGQSGGSQYRQALGELLWEKGDKEKAVKVWMERANTQKAETYLGMGRTYLKQGAFDDADKAFARACELDPDNVQIRMAIAEQAFQRGDLKAMLPHMLEVFNQGNAQANSGQYSYYQRADQGESQLTQWSAAVAADPGVMDYLNTEAAEKAGEYRVMLAWSTGDWAEVEKRLAEKVKAGSSDPVVWTLWAKVQQRQGNWAEAGKALEFLKRAKQTTIASHRDRLKLVLAGKGFKEAAAGTRQAAPGAGMGAPGAGGYQQRYYGGYYDNQSGGDLLPSIYIKLGDVQKAERSYLISGGGDGVEGRLPLLAGLMWNQKGKDRALELMRLALMVPSGRYSSGRNMLPQYAGMLAEAGKLEEATDLLVRAYCWDSTGERDSMYESMYGYHGYGQDESVDRGQGEQVASSMFEILTKYGTYEATLKKLAEESAKNPEDPKLAQLVISLQKRGGRWEELKASLVGWKKARPNDLAMKLEEFHASCQLRQWDDALKTIAEIKAENPNRAEKWALSEAFVHFLKGDMEAVATGLEPVLAGVGADEREQSAAAVLLMTGAKLDKVAAQMEERLKAGDLPSSARPALFKLYMAMGKKDEALALGLGELWKQPQVLSETTEWYRLLCRLVGNEGANGQVLKTAAARPADAAMLVLITRGAQEGMAAFRTLAEVETPSLEALRGMALAASLSGDEAATRRANEKLVAWLKERRYQLWYQDASEDLQRVAKTALEQAGKGGTTQIVMSGSVGSQLFDALGRQSDDSKKSFDALYVAHEKWQRELLARAGQAEQLKALVKAQERRLEGGRGQYDPYSRYGAYGSASYYATLQGYAGNQYGGEQEDVPQTDWRAGVRAALWRARQLGALASEYERLGMRTPRQEWRTVELVNAAMGDAEAAQKWRLAKAESMLAALQSGDTPDLGSSTRDPWRWYYGYSSAQQDLWRIRQALRVGVTEDYKDEETDTRVQGEADELWELAVIVPSVGERLEAAGKSVGLGWGSTRTFQQLLSYYWAKEQPQKIVELVEKAYERDRVISCPQLGFYVWACHRVKAYEKVEAVLNAALEASSTLKNDVDVARMALLRASGKSAEAAAIEETLLKACVRETPNDKRMPWQLEDGAAVALDEEDGDEYFQQAQQQTSRNRRYNQQRYQQPQGRMESVAEVARAVSVRYDPKVREEDVTLAEMRRACQALGLHQDVERLLDRELAECTDVRQRAALLETKLKEQWAGKKGVEATRTAAQLEGVLLGLVKERPGDSGLRVKLAELYMSKEFGKQYERALEALAAAKRLDPASDRDGALTVHCLYKLNRHKEAAEAWRRAQMAGAMRGAYAAPTIFYAATSAVKAGDSELGKSLANQALHMYPSHPLVAQTRELIK